MPHAVFSVGLVTSTHATFGLVKWVNRRATHRRNGVCGLFRGSRKLDPHYTFGGMIPWGSCCDPRNERPILLVADVGGESNCVLTAPIFGRHTRLYRFSEAGIFPPPWTTHISMLNGVVMDVIEMMLKILFILNLMLPKASLPHSLLLLA